MASPSYVQLIRNGRFPDDLRVMAFAGVISRALTEERRPLVRGLTEASFERLMKTCFPGIRLRNGPCQRDEDAIDEFDDVLELLRDHCVAPGEIDEWLSCCVASAAMQEQHLWQDMGMPNRALLSRLLQENFPALARRNVNDMKWKKFFYRELCQRDGLTICKSPNCADCSDYLFCFGPETPALISPVLVAHRT